jgi:hypothetical protein
MEAAKNNNHTMADFYCRTADKALKAESGDSSLWNELSAKDRLDWCTMAAEYCEPNNPRVAAKFREEAESLRQNNPHLNL